MDFFVHFLLPHHSNNHRPKILHNPSLLILAFIILVFGFILPLIKAKAPSVLGIATDITIEKLIKLTNEERVRNGLGPLYLDPQLSRAAEGKARDMFYRNYWAHNSTDGKTPWIFITDSGYQYTYAGENLARDFANTNSVVNAWMASTGHRANILSPNYQDIGFAVVNGELDGRETTLVVQLFGARKQGSVARIPQENLTSKPMVFGYRASPLIDSKFLTRNMAVSVLGFLMVVLIIDLIVAHRKKLVRLVGHNLDHIIFLGSLVPTIIIDKGGVIL